MKRTILAGLVLAAAGLVGCEATVEPARVEVGVPVPAVDVYYEQGYYDGGFWVYHDREGHVLREARDVHERRMTQIKADRERRTHEEHHEEHHDDHH